MCKWIMVNGFACHTVSCAGSGASTGRVVRVRNADDEPSKRLAVEHFNPPELSGRIGRREKEMGTIKCEGYLVNC